MVYRRTMAYSIMSEKLFVRMFLLFYLYVNEFCTHLVYITSSGSSLMYSRKSVGLRMEPWRTPALTGYSCEGFLSRTTELLITEKRRNKANDLTWNSIRLKFVKGTSKADLVKSLGYIKCNSWRVAWDLPKALAILSDTAARRSAVDWETWNTENQIKQCISLGDHKNPIIYKFFKDFTKKTYRVVVFSYRPFPDILNTENSNKAFQQSEKPDSFRHLLNSSADM